MDCHTGMKVGSEIDYKFYTIGLYGYYRNMVYHRSIRKIKVMIHVLFQCYGSLSSRHFHAIPLYDLHLFSDAPMKAYGVVILIIRTHYFNM